jgi:hypothetical protein
MPVQFLGTLIVVCAMERFEDYSLVIHRHVNVFHHFSAVRNWSQQELADRLEVSRQSVYASARWTLRACKTTQWSCSSNNCAAISPSPAMKMRLMPLRPFHAVT